jgi:hypothetical protein
VQVKETYLSAPHPISYEPQDPPSLLLPVLPTAVQHPIQQRYVACVDLLPLEEESACGGVDEAGGVADRAEGVSEEEGDEGGRSVWGSGGCCGRTQRVAEEVEGVEDLGLFVEEGFLQMQ